MSDQPRLMLQWELEYNPYHLHGVGVARWIMQTVTSSTGRVRSIGMPYQNWTTHHLQNSMRVLRAG